MLQNEADYKNFNSPRSKGGGSNLNETILRTGKLEETLSEGETPHPASEGELRQTLVDKSNAICLFVIFIE